MKFSKIANKSILLDIPTSSLLSSLKQRRIDYGLSVKKLAEKLCINHWSVQCYEQRKSPPCLLNLMNISEFFRYDLSESLNYKFFHGLIQADKIKARMKTLGLTCAELARQTGYCRGAVYETINLRSGTSLFSLNAVLNVLGKEVS